MLNLRAQVGNDSRGHSRVHVVCSPRGILDLWRALERGQCRFRAFNVRRVRHGAARSDPPERVLLWTAMAHASIFVCHLRLLFTHLQRMRDVRAVPTPYSRCA